MYLKCFLYDEYFSILDINYKQLNFFAMKRYKKILFWGLVAVVGAFSVVSCDDGEDEDGGVVTQDTQQTDNPLVSDGENSSSTELQGVSGDFAKEITAAFDYINKIRQNPSAYSSELGVDLSYVEERPALNWNENLAKAAQAKAEDMAANNYFSHTDLQGYGMNIKINEAGYTLESSWYSDVSANYFENISAGIGTGLGVVKQLVVDAGTNPPGHRNSLLGIGDFYSGNVDIGIGVGYNSNSTYKYYWSILVARHSW